MSSKPNDIEVTESPEVCPNCGYDGDWFEFDDGPAGCPICYEGIEND